MGTYINANPPAVAPKQSQLNLHYYDDIYCIDSISDYLVNDIGNAIGHIFTNPDEYIYYLRCFPFDISLLDTHPTNPKAYVYFGNEQSNFKMKYLTADFKSSLNLGTFAITPKYNSYLDYAPYTKITLYLPYIGFVELDPNEVMGRTLTVDYLLDLDNAETLVTISVVDTENPYVIRTERGKIGIDIPIGSSNMRDQIRNMVSSTIGLVGGTLAMTPSSKGFTASAIGTSVVTKSASNIFNALQMRYSKGTTATQGINNLTMPQSIYVIYERNNLVYSPTVTKGKPLNEQRLLNDIHGYTEIGKFLDNMNLGYATKDEIEEIKNLLITGIFLP